MKKLELTGFQLKLIALAGMIVDHVNTHFGHHLGFPIWVSWVGRFVAPVFLYLLMEGFTHTSNRSNYFKRLYTGAFVMFVINLVKNIVTGQYYNPLTKEFDAFLLLNGNNIFLTLTCFYIIFSLVERIQTKDGNKWKHISFLIPMILLTCLTEGGLYLLPFGLVLAWFHGSKRITVWALAVTSLLFAVKAIMNYYSLGYAYTDLYHYLGFDNQFMQWLAIPLIMRYNGQRGGSGERWEKDLFYMIYPAHLVVIYILEFFIQ
ncbi:MULTISPECIES: TraX family protein [unclassified Streptococcus]|uniref:TraX family protein n=1 Tax=unclassified Streptococcus TaxID=2608887 RepID=UPI001072289A|nr:MULTISPECIES: TraX family protein [unclassified Streptococcus]MBF0787243.1 hypothetical protein [Streptococcus sp. 19428wC2_LYSM12]MCQ9211929.1 conjugal transfer protein TraX [Streptococcus sp. B01]MCQ9213256.1 conjugal transfer protein TraX [Streptococcus sp. O1]TFV05872.1 hypothetical protein E4T79_04940 [Streptococcus sp. LYSM12]